MSNLYAAGFSMGRLLLQAQEQARALTGGSPLANLLAVAEAQRAQPEIERVLAQGQRLQKLFADLLLLASLERPGARTSMQGCDLAEITADVVEDWSEIAVASEQTLSMALEAETTMLRGNERELSRLLINLISNALQHSPCGGTVAVAWAWPSLRRSPTAMGERSAWRLNRGTESHSRHCCQRSAEATQSP